MSMTSVPVDDFIDDLTAPAPGGAGVAGLIAWLAQFRDWAEQQTGGAAEDAVTLASDTFTPTHSINALDTEGGAGTDTLATIGQTGVPDGQPILIRGTNSGRVITVTHGAGGTGQVLLADSTNFVLSSPTQWLWLVRRGTSWVEILRGYGSNVTAFRAYLGLVIGTNVQAYSAILAALAGVTGAADKLPYFTGAAAMDVTDFPAFGRSLVACEDGDEVQALIGSSGAVVQVVNSQDGAVATGSTVLPYDDTKPQNTEGNQYLSATITPTSVSNKLLIEVVANLDSSAALGTLMSGALFMDSGADALAAAAVVVNQAEVQLVLRHYMTAPDTSAHTFKFRAGASAAGTTTFNGRSGNRRFGGINASSITVTEIIP